MRRKLLQPLTSSADTASPRGVATNLLQQPRMSRPVHCQLCASPTLWLRGVAALTIFDPCAVLGITTASCRTLIRPRWPPQSACSSSPVTPPPSHIPCTLGQDVPCVFLSHSLHSYLHVHFYRTFLTSMYIPDCTVPTSSGLCQSCQPAQFQPSLGPVHLLPACTLASGVVQFQPSFGLYIANLVPLLRSVHVLPFLGLYTACSLLH